MSNGENLRAAKRDKNDEFYTQLTDIEKELRYYRKHFKDKTVLCNCDDPFESKFFEYFVKKFNSLGLKKLIATCYAGSPIAGKSLALEEFGIEPGFAYKAVVTQVYDKTGDGYIDMKDIAALFKSGENELVRLEGDGDFRSDECLALLDEADIVVTNPPFSLFREYVAVLMEHEKKFLIIGNQNAITYKEFFPLLKDDSAWMGYTSPKEFTVPVMLADRGNMMLREDGSYVAKFGNICWFTNLDIRKRHEEIDLYKRYDPELYPTYDNYDAIEVSKVAEIPCDYPGAMGVPITFLDKYNPEQFEILGLTTGRKEFGEDAWPSKRYVNAIQHNKDGSTTSGSKANTRATIRIDGEPSGVYYTADNANYPLEIVYARILIRNLHPEPPRCQSATESVLTAQAV